MNKSVYDTIGQRRDMMRCICMRSKADVSRLSLLHGTEEIRGKLKTKAGILRRNAPVKSPWSQS